MFCTHCGIQNSDSNQFCSQCGTPLYAPAPQTPPVAPMPPQQPVLPLQAPSVPQQPVPQQPAPQYHAPTPEPPPVESIDPSTMNDAEFRSYKQSQLAIFAQRFQYRIGQVLASPITVVLALLLSYTFLSNQLPMVDDLLDSVSYLKGYETWGLYIVSWLQISATVLYCVGLWITFLCSLSKTNLSNNDVLAKGMLCVKIGANLMITASIITLLVLLVPVLELLFASSSLFKYVLMLLFLLGMQIATRSSISRLFSSMQENVPRNAPDPHVAKPLMITSGILAGIYLLIMIDTNSMLGLFSAALGETQGYLGLNLCIYLLVCIGAAMYYKAASDLELEHLDLLHHFHNVRKPVPTSRSSYNPSAGVPAWKRVEMNKKDQP